MYLPNSTHGPSLCLAETIAFCYVFATVETLLQAGFESDASRLKVICRFALVIDCFGGQAVSGRKRLAAHQGHEAAAPFAGHSQALGSLVHDDELLAIAPPDGEHETAAGR